MDVDAKKPTAARPLSLTPRFSGVQDPSRNSNRFSGFLRRVKTAKAVQVFASTPVTQAEAGC